MKSLVRQNYFFTVKIRKGAVKRIGWVFKWKPEQWKLSWFSKSALLFWESLFKIIFLGGEFCQRMEVSLRVNVAKKIYNAENATRNFQSWLGTIIVPTLELLVALTVERLMTFPFPLTRMEKYMSNIVSLIIIVLLEAASTRDGFSLALYSDHLRQKIIFMIN